MEKNFSFIAILILVLALLLCACGTTPDRKNEDTTTATEEIVESIEAEVELDPDWLGDAAIDEVYDCLFPSEGEIDVEEAQEILLPLVEAGNAEAQYYLGYIYSKYAADVTGDAEKEGLYWYELAAEKEFSKAYLAAALNNFTDPGRKTELLDKAKQAGIFESLPGELGPDGCDLLGDYYCNEREDDSSAISWWKFAANMGNTSAMNQLGYHYYVGTFGEKNVEYALEWLLRSAEAGNVYGMYNYASVTLDKEVALFMINKKYAVAYPEYQKAAAAGDPEALYNIAVMYCCGYGGLGEDYDKYKQWLLKAAEAGHPTAMFLQGDLSSDPLEAEEWYLKAAEAGHSEAMYRVGQALTDPVEAAKWYIKSAEAGYRDAIIMLQNIYSSGIGVEQDHEKVDKWFEKYNELEDCILHNDNNEYGNILLNAIAYYEEAAEKGFGPAMNNLGYWYTKAMKFTEWEPGRTVSQTLHYDKQEHWYMKAAAIGYNTAMGNLGDLYKNGGGYVIKQNYDEAMKWYVKAYAHGKDNVADDINDMLMKKQGINAYFENYGELISPNS